MGVLSTQTDDLKVKVKSLNKNVRKIEKVVSKLSSDVMQKINKKHINPTQQMVDTPQ